MADNQSFSIQGFNLVTLLKRLEAATSRLEDVTVFQEKHVLGKEANSEIINTNNNNNTSHIQDKEESTKSSTLSVTPSIKPIEKEIEIPKSITEFDNFINEQVKPYVELSKKIDSILGEQSEIFLDAILKERGVLNAAIKSKKIKIDDNKFQNLIIKPINELIMKVIKIKDDNRNNQYFNYLNAVSEGVAVLGWIVVETPVSYIPEFKDSAQFWTNRILKDVKGKDDEKLSVEWVKQFLSIFDNLKNYVKEFQTTGISWGGNEDFEKVINELTSTSSSTVQSALPPPPPPPPPPANLFDDINNNNNNNTTTTTTNDGGMNAVFAELNKGENITSGLKKVDKSQMTHKNPELRKKHVPLPPKKPKNLSNKSESENLHSNLKKNKKKPQNELIDNKWMITNICKGDIENNLIVIEGNINESVYIGNCEDIVVQIKGKVNAISINLSERVGIVIEKAISSVEMTKCKKCEIQITDNVPIINVDQSESTNIYLNEKSINVEIYSSCCTALNVNIPDNANKDDLKEVSISEQFVTRFDPISGKVTTEAVSHA